MKLLPPPGPDRTRQLRYLGVLLVLALGVGWYEWSSYVPTDTPVAASNGQARAPETVGPLVIPEAVKLAALEPVPDQPDIGRNLFRFGVHPPPPRPPEPPHVDPPPLPPPPPPGPPPIPPVPLQLLGISESQPGQRTAIMKDTSTGAQVYGFDGAIIDGRYRCVKVGLESVTVSYLDGTGLRTIPLNR